MEEEKIKNPLEISCEEAEEIAKMESEGKASFMEKALLEEHLKNCQKCREQSGEKEQD